MGVDPGLPAPGPLGLERPVLGRSQADVVITFNTSPSYTPPDAKIAYPATATGSRVTVKPILWSWSTARCLARSGSSRA